MANAVYNSYKDDLIEGNNAFLTDTIHVMLVTSAYTADVDAHTRKTDITNEVAGTGYTAGGTALASKTSTQDNTNNRGVMDAADLTWASSTITARAAVQFNNGATKYLFFYIDFGADKSSSASDFTIQWHANGISYIS